MLIGGQTTPAISSPRIAVQGPAFLLIQILDKFLASSTGTPTILTFAWIYVNYGHAVSTLGLMIIA